MVINGERKLKKQTTTTTTKLQRIYNARKATVFKKAKELSALCATDVLLILYESNHPQETPLIWCSKPNQEATIINKYLTQRNPDRQNMFKAVDNHSIKYKKEKQSTSVAKQGIDDMGFEELKELVGILEGKIQLVSERIDWMRSATGYQWCDPNYSDLSSDYDDGLMSFFDGNDNGNGMIDYGNEFMGDGDIRVNDDDFNVEVLNDLMMMNGGDFTLGFPQDQVALH